MREGLPAALTAVDLEGAGQADGRRSHRAGRPPRQAQQPIAPRCGIRCSGRPVGTDEAARGRRRAPHGGWHRRLRPGGMTVRRHGSPRTTTAPRLRQPNCRRREEPPDGVAGRSDSTTAAATGRRSASAPMATVGGAGQRPRHANTSTRPSLWPTPPTGTRRDAPGRTASTVASLFIRTCGVTIAWLHHGSGTVTHPWLTARSCPRLGGRKGRSPMVSSPPRPAIGTDNVDVACQVSVPV
jgi:hypothetical protein